MLHLLQASLSAHHCKTSSPLCHIPELREVQEDHSKQQSHLGRLPELQRGYLVRPASFQEVNFSPSLSPSLMSKITSCFLTSNSSPVRRPGMCVYIFVTPSTQRSLVVLRFTRYIYFHYNSFPLFLAKYSVFITTL